VAGHAEDMLLDMLMSGKQFMFDCWRRLTHKQKLIGDFLFGKHKEQFTDSLHMLIYLH
jgi:hypothetical protein